VIPEVQRRDGRLDGPPARAARGFAELLARDRKPMGPPPPPVAAGMGSTPSLLRRRASAGLKDEELSERRRDFDRSGQAEGERRAQLQPARTAAEPRPAPSPTATTLAAEVQRLALLLERRDRAEGPSLEMQFGTSLRLRLTRAPRGIEVSVAADHAMARLAEAELPALLHALRRLGIAVARAEVRRQGLPGAAAGRVDVRGGLR
jgi:hypothetical protein